MALNNEIEDRLLMSIDRKKTSVGNNGILNSVVADGDYIEELAIEQFDDIKRRLNELGINGTPEELANELSELLLNCKKAEEPFKENLEKLCINIAIKLFAIPKNMVKIEANIVDGVEIDNKAVSLDKIKGDYSLDSIKDNEILKDECDKRNIFNALCVGAGLYYARDKEIYIEELSKINPSLPVLYDKITAINEYLLFCNNINLMENDERVSGIAIVKDNGPGEVFNIKAQGIIFPILLFETIRGVMELFASDSLPRDRKLAAIVAGKCDYIKREPWDMRIGIGLWEDFRRHFNSRPQMIQYWFRFLAGIKSSKFKGIVPEILSNTTIGKKYTQKIYRTALRHFDKDNFDSEMSTLSLKKNIITDSVLKTDE